MTDDLHPAQIIAKTIAEMEDEVMMVTGMVVAITYVGEDGADYHGYYQLPNQTSIVTNGLADAASFYARKNFVHDDH